MEQVALEKLESHALEMHPEHLRNFDVTYSHSTGISVRTAFI